MAKKSMWRLLTVMSAAAFALAIAASAFAQAPPSPPHQFFGSADTGSGAELDGEALPDGTVITAWNQDGDAVGTATIGDTDTGVWTMQVSPDDADSVTFSVDGSDQSASFDVESGSFAEVGLALSSLVVAPPVDPTPGLPATGSGGLVGGSSLPVLPLALVASVIVALGGVMAVRRTRA